MQHTVEQQFYQHPHVWSITIIIKHLILHCFSNNSMFPWTALEFEVQSGMKYLQTRLELWLGLFFEVTAPTKYILTTTRVFNLSYSLYDLLPSPPSECVLIIILLIIPFRFVFFQVHTVSLLTFLFLPYFNRNSFHLWATRTCKCPQWGSNKLFFIWKPSRAAATFGGVLNLSTHVKTREATRVV